MVWFSHDATTAGGGRVFPGTLQRPAARRFKRSSRRRRLNRRGMPAKTAAGRVPIHFMKKRARFSRKATVGGTVDTGRPMSFSRMHVERVLHHTSRGVDTRFSSVLPIAASEGVISRVFHWFRDSFPGLVR